MIVCGSYPSENESNSVARVIYVKLQDIKTKKETYVMPDEPTEFGYEWVKLTDNRKKTLGSRKTYFTVMGNTIESEFRDIKFFEYTYGVIRGANVRVVKAINEQCGIHDIVEFKGVELTITIPKMD